VPKKHNYGSAIIIFNMNATKRACDFLKLYGLQVLKEVSITVSHSAHDCTTVWIPVYVSSVLALFAPEKNV
jgi:hypothetical protein